MKKDRLHVYALCVLGVLLFLIAWVILFHREYLQFSREERIEFLVNDLTVSSRRQQDAMDEIVKDGDGSFVYLLRYLDDHRKLATTNVHFLNLHPAVSEKYFLIESRTVDELVLRYLCWKTASCDPWYSSADAEAARSQRAKIEKYCRERFIDPKRYKKEQEYWRKILWPS